LWLLGYPEAALSDIDHALTDAREIGQVATLMYLLGLTGLTHFFRGNDGPERRFFVVLEGAPHDEPWLCIGYDRETRRRSSSYYFWNNRSALDGSNTECVVLPFGENLCGPQAIR
jgi:hypothetical protein